MQMNKKESEKKQGSKEQVGIVVFSLLLMMSFVINLLEQPIALQGRRIMTFVWPKAEDKKQTGSWVRDSIYWLTDVDIENPVTILEALFPRYDEGKKVKTQLAQVNGYFTQDENSYLTKEEVLAAEEEANMNDRSILEVPKLSGALPDLSDVEEVYGKYYTNSGKMDFGLDMIERWDFNELAQKELALRAVDKGPQVLIFHTHCREAYVGGATVVDVGEALKETLENQYGVSVLHITDSFYEDDNQTAFPTRGEYERMEVVIEKVLRENPSISVVIDLHRDGVNSDVHLVTDIEGKQTAKIMFVNGLCLNRNLEGKVEDKAALPNPYLKENLAFSLQSLMTMNACYPGLGRKIYLAEWRFSTHMCPQSLLVEWGAQTNTSDEAMNAVEPFARVLMNVLQKD